ncbi:MAG: hypothetical protein RMK91_12540 [Pseudanabaenaceae cyanobacterium SKYGB_i_bin29]|nr:hypothetical protein [Pseudanabaenaceae cyanobacterium SKYG29]MDW8422682.1 hypothetical protein [Pseudanabaenaceae cyanobacterium SKYGB_i_bin29]
METNVAVPTAKGGEVIVMELVSLEFFQTPRGERLYALFRKADGQSFGIWTEADDLISQLQPGDRAYFRRIGRNSYEFFARAD